MNKAKFFIIIFWLSSYLLTWSPFHVFANNDSAGYSIVILLIIVALAFAPVSANPNLGDSLFNKKEIRQLCVRTSLLLTTLSVVAFLTLFKQTGFSLNQNRDLFGSDFKWYNYLSIMLFPNCIYLSVSKHSSGFERTVGRLAWASGVLLLLFSGNRQFVFFSAAFLFLHRIGKQKNRKISIINYGALVFAGISFSVIFSFIRLDYLPVGSAGVVADYMSGLTGAVCIDEDKLPKQFDEIYQLLYAYLGLNWSGFRYSVDFFYDKGGIPALSSTIPVLYRRLESLELVASANSNDDRLGYYVNSIAGGNYSHFFTTMFGSIGIEFGWLGIFVFSLTMFLSLRYLSKRSAADEGDEIDYWMFISVQSMLIFGILQFPLTEPFYFVFIVELVIIYLMRGKIPHRL